MNELLKGQRILIVEDNFYMALDLGQMIEDLGGEVVGPAGRLAEGLTLAKSGGLAAAILDAKLDGEDSFSLADQLLAAHVPVVFATGYDSSILPKRFADLPLLSKPFNAASVENAIRSVTA
jgi:DNA-binding response OmpR family regulator